MEKLHTYSLFINLLYHPPVLLRIPILCSFWQFHHPLLLYIVRYFALKIIVGGWKPQSGKESPREASDCYEWSVNAVFILVLAIVSGFCCWCVLLPLAPVAADNPALLPPPPPSHHAVILIPLPLVSVNVLPSLHRPNVSKNQCGRNKWLFSDICGFWFFLFHWFKTNVS